MPTLLFFKTRWETRSFKKMQPAPDLSPSSLSQLAGSYSNDEAGSSFRIISEGANVYYWHDPNTKEKLKPTYIDGFHNDDYWIFEFRRDKKNQIVGATMSIDRAQQVPFKKK